MAKSKKRKKVRRPPKRLSAKLMGEVASAMELYEEGDPLTARNQLLELARKNPRSQTVLLAILEVSQEMQDWHTFAYYSERLLPLERKLDRAETLNNLVYAYTQLLYPALAFHYAKELVNQHPDFEDVDHAKSFTLMIQEYLI